MYKSRRRPWVKLYCRDWLTSTVRFDMTELDRSRFIDLLALAGDSKVPGVVCAGYDGDRKLTGFPIDWLASTMRCRVAELRESLKKFASQDRIEISGKDDFPIIKITSWKKYQSEYLRQVESLSKRKALQDSLQKIGRSSETSPQLPKTEVEVEVDREGEEEKPYVLPDWIPLEAWKDFKEMRNRTRKPMTAKAEKMAIRKLESLKAMGCDPKEVLEESVLHCWASVYPTNNRSCMKPAEKEAAAGTAQPEQRIPPPCPCHHSTGGRCSMCMAVPCTACQ